MPRSQESKVIEFVSIQQRQGDVSHDVSEQSMQVYLS